jgi:hypothetical protein
VEADTEAQQRDEIVTSLQQRIRYLLTLKGRPPFRLAGIEMYDRLSEVNAYVQSMVDMYSDDRLRELQHGLEDALSELQDTSCDLHQAAAWLEEIAAVLNPEGKASEQAKRYVSNALTIWTRFRSRGKTNLYCMTSRPIFPRRPTTMPQDYFIRTTSKMSLAPIMIEKANSGESFSRFPAQQVRKGPLAGSFCVQEPGK